MTLRSAILMGLGSMIGAGIFVLLGEAGAVAGSGVWLSFVLAGMIALLTGYSYGKLGARYPSAGGVVEYLTQGYGIGVLSGAISLLYYIAQIISISMLAVSFGIYGAPLLFGSGVSRMAELALGSVLLIEMTIVNFVGSKTVSKAEAAIVGINVCILLVFTLPALVQIEPQLLAPSTYPAAPKLLSSLAFTFFAFTGFGVIANTAEDIDNPNKNLPRAMMLAIGIVMVLYVAIALAVFGTLPVDKVIAAKNTALAEAAKPILGSFGFILISISAILATAASTNASLYGTTHQTYLLAKDGELPEKFDRLIWRQGTEGLSITAVAALFLVWMFDLTAIASLASITMLIVYLMVNIGHLRLTRKTGARRDLVLLATLTCFATVVLFAAHLLTTSPKTAATLVGFILVAFVAEYLLQAQRRRTIRPRCK